MSASDAPSRERPSRHGKILGQFLSAVAEVGRTVAPECASRGMCSTCAFRDGAMPNQMAATALTAFNCVMGVDPDQFACHHGMREGVPTKLCAGYLLAKLAPWPEIQAECAKLKQRMDEAAGPDEVRANFESWLNEVDPGRTLDDYALARLFARASSRTAQALSDRGPRG